MFSANGSLLFSPEIDDDDNNGNTLKFAKAAHVLSPIQSVLSGRGEGKGASERSTKVLSKEDLIRQGKQQTMRRNGGGTMEHVATWLGCDDGHGVNGRRKGRQ